MSKDPTKIDRNNKKWRGTAERLDEFQWIFQEKYKSQKVISRKNSGLYPLSRKRSLGKTIEKEGVKLTSPFPLPFLWKFQEFLKILSFKSFENSQGNIARLHWREMF